MQVSKYWTVAGHLDRQGHCEGVVGQQRVKGHPTQD